MMLPANPLDTLGARVTEIRDTFLASARAGVICAREFDRLSDDIADRMATPPPDLDAPPADVRRAPGRCIVQLGPVGLTVSWVRARVDTVANGRLMIIEWLGVVARGAHRLPERNATSVAAMTAKVLREEILLAEATSEHDWMWKRETPSGANLHSTELAQHCVSALRETLASEKRKTNSEQR